MAGSGRSPRLASFSVRSRSANASVHAFTPRAGESVVFSGTAGDAGSVAVQLARRAGVNEIGLAQEAHSRCCAPWASCWWPTERARSTATARRDRVDVLITAAATSIWASPWACRGADQRDHRLRRGGRVGAQTLRISQIASPEILADLNGLEARGELEVPIARTHPAGRVCEVYAELARRPHSREDRARGVEMW